MLQKSMCEHLVCSKPLLWELSLSVLPSLSWLGGFLHNAAMCLRELM